MSQFEGQNYYEILEVDVKASLEEIHKAYQRAKTTYSPNSPALYTVFSHEEADELLAIIQEAYTVLSDPIRRRDYDERLSTNQPQPAVESTQTSNEEEDLPDFAIPEAGSTHWNEEESEPGDVVRTEPSKPSSSGNVGRTRYSEYEIEPLFEDEISNNEIFDGEFLQKVRLYKNLTLERVSEITRIGKHYLAAIESNNFSNLPAKVFVRGFVVQVARTLEIDEKKVTDSFMKFYDAHQ
jgi:hypothetical protein